MRLTKRQFKRHKGNSINDVKSQLLTTFSIIALTTSFIVFFAFSLRLVFQEDAQVESHLKSFEEVAIKYYRLDQVKSARLSQFVTAYYTPKAFSQQLREHAPYSLNQVSPFRTYSEDGFVVYHTNFDFQGKVVPLYLTINSQAIEFGDENWDALMVLSMLLMVFLIVVLRFSLKRVFEGLMSPILELSGQLKNADEGAFHVNEHAIDELKNMTKELNQYAQMKDRVTKQELMFAKYASHELKTPIAVIIGAAELQGMKVDPQFQSKQRERILKAATQMQQTVEVLLNIVKQENTASELKERCIVADEIDFSDFVRKLDQKVSFSTQLTAQTTTNMPPAVLAMILKNLLSNATRFTHQGAIEVSISSDMVRVADTGVGFSTQTESEHGLGLLIVERLCNSYGWSLSIGDNPNQTGCLVELKR
ncbi:HAMP domain-containing histidine kinase [Vibrio kasasachensis]|uniref:sensor histidine kinase n=1 Tax=Vibrio kasasachensis TaxID=2910248 RepID=UPI003D0A292E